MKVHFPLLNETLDLSPALLVSEACEAIGHPLNLVCGGKGKCKKCKVSVIVNDRREEVLACTTPISENMSIYISKETASSQILELTKNADLPFNPIVKNYALNYVDLVTPMCEFDLDVIRKLTGVHIVTPEYTVLKLLSEVYRLKGYEKLNVIMAKDKIIDLVPHNEEKTIYGIAFDIGTTSVVGFLYDLCTGVLLNQYSILNEQIAFGGDVISRIDFASNNPENLNKIHNAIMSTLTKIINTLCHQTKVPSQDIYQTVYCGNSTMQHLFLELNPKHLGLSPFTSFISDSVQIKGEAFNLPINPKGYHVFMPLLGGFVGGDTTSVLLSLPRDEKMRMMIDLGTNGEIAIGNHKKLYVASTACGPALEGAGLSMGMRGTTGAIEKITYEGGTFKLKVIGNVPPIGFCGSGIIDAIATLFRLKLIAPRGNFIKGEELEAHPLKDRFSVDADGQRSFAIVTAEEHPEGKVMQVSQKDIRAVQLAKGAIYTGCCLLTKNYGINGTELSEIVLAGAFGNYIDVENAQYIGLLPNIEGVPVISIGNGAGTGAQLYLLSREEADFCDTIPDVTTHVELASDPNFTNTYMMNTKFGSSTLI